MGSAEGEIIMKYRVSLSVAVIVALLVAYWATLPWGSILNDVTVVDGCVKSVFALTELKDSFKTMETAGIDLSEVSVLLSDEQPLLQYKLRNGEAMITGVQPDVGVPDIVIIPPIIDVYDVTHINLNAFMVMPIDVLSLPNTLLSIDMDITRVHSSPDSVNQVCYNGVLYACDTSDGLLDLYTALKENDVAVYEDCLEGAAL